MGSKSDYLENEILDHILGGADYSRPASVWLALLTAAPTDASTGSTITEATYTGYARKEITNNATNFPAASSGAKSNGTEIAFAECTAGSSTVTHWALLDASTAGNILYWGALTTSKDISAGDTPKVAVGDLDITED